MKKNLTLKVGKLKGLNVKKVNVTPKNARKTVDLGDGFERFEFSREVPGNTFYTFTFTAAANKIVISAGWGWPFSRAFPVLSHPQGNNRWVISLPQTNPSALTVTFYFITKVIS